MNQSQLRLFGIDLGDLLADVRNGWTDAFASPVMRRLLPDEPVRLRRPDGGECIVFRGGVTSAAGGRAAKAWGVILPASLVLDRTLRLPVLAAEDMEKALALEIASASPFPPEDVVWGWSLAADDDAGCFVRLVLASRAQVEDYLRGHADAGGGEVWADGVPPVLLRGFGEQSRLQRRRRASRQLLGLLMLSVLLAGALVASPLLVERQRVFAAQQSFHDLQRASADVVAARDGLTSTAELLARLELDRQAYPDMLALLESLSSTLADDVVLSQIDVQRGGVVRIAGDALNASQVMAALEQHARVSDVRSPAPTRRNVQTGKESFVIEFAFLAPRESS